MYKQYDGYGAIFSIYDNINSNVEYGAWADFFEECFDRYLPCRPELVLDLACGTGSMTLELAKRGYDMIGVDGSSDMLNIAFDRKYDLELKNDVLFLLQDMREFELYGTVGAITCCLDSLNYLTGEGELDKVLSLVHNYLDPDGMFIFDVNTPHKFKSVYGQNTYVYDEDDCGGDSFCIWQNYFEEDTALCDFKLTVFEKDGESELYIRRDEEQCERCYFENEIISALERNNLELIGAYSDFDFTPSRETDERWYFVARAKK